MSSSRLKPEVTPLTALARSARMRPCRALTEGRSPVRVTTTCSPSTATLIPTGRGCCSAPFGPLTCTTPSATVTWTALWIGMGFFPMRDMAASLPHAAHDLAAEARLARLGVGHEPLGGRDHGDAHAAPDLGQLLDAAIHPQARPGNALQTVDRGLAVRRVAQVEPQRALGAFLQHFEGADEPLLLEDLRKLELDLGRRRVAAVLAYEHRVADPGEEVGDRIGHRHHTPPTSSPWSRPGGIPPGRACGSTAGKARTCACTRAGGRRACNGCGAARGTSAAAAIWQ